MNMRGKLKGKVKKAAAISMLAGLTATAGSRADNIVDWLEKGLVYGVLFDAGYYLFKGESLKDVLLKATGYSRGWLNGKDNPTEDGYKKLKDE